MGLPDYPPIEKAASPNDIVDLIKAVSNCEIPAFTVVKGIGMSAITEAFETSGWNVHQGKIERLPKPGSKPPKDLKRVVPSPGYLHWDGEGDLTLRAHIASTCYNVLLATPTEAVPDMSHSLWDILFEEFSLWRGIIDQDTWEDIRLHRGQPNQPVVFRSRGPYPVAHDFQASRLKRRKFIVNQATPA